LFIPTVPPNACTPVAGVEKVALAVDAALKIVNVVGVEAITVVALTLKVACVAPSTVTVLPALGGVPDVTVKVTCPS
jgi:hypothetical protein